MAILFGKKRISESKLANVLVNSIVEFADKGFPEVVDIIIHCPEFTSPPEISVDDNSDFLMILLVGNLNFVNIYLDANQSKRVKELVTAKFADIFGVDAEELAKTKKAYKEYLAKVNYPSKNMVHAMSKGVFFKYNLNEYQEEFFKSQKTPNPIFHKKLDDVLSHFIFNWETFLSKYKVVEK